MAREKKWETGSFDQVKVKIPKDTNKKYKGWLVLKGKTAQDHLQEEIEKVAN